MKKIQDIDIEQIALNFSLTFKQVKTVLLVEAQGTGFLPSGKVKILFEAHHFSKLTNHIYDKTHPDISSLKWNKNLYKGPEGEWLRIEKAKSLNKSAALKSASWGLGQIMGSNHLAAGYKTVEEMVESFSNSEFDQLKGMMNLIKSNSSMFIALKTLDWAKFAKLYNGESYKVNKYDLKLMNTYATIK